MRNDWHRDLAMLKEFREFALKGNMVDLAVGIIIGAAFSGLVNSVVKDLITPVIAVITGGIDFTNLFYGLSPAVTATSLEAARAEGPVIAYGNFITLLINFLIVAFILFLIVKAMNRLKRKEAEKPPEAAEVPRQEKLLEEIRDLMAVATGRDKRID